MFKIGEYNRLVVSKRDSEGVYLKGKDSEEVLLPKQHIQDELKVGDEIEVFVYNDSDGGCIATTKRPKITVNSFAFLEVVTINKIGAFFDIGLDRDLLVPHREQIGKVNIGDKKIVHMFLDDEGRGLTGSMLWREFCFDKEHSFELNQKVEIMIGEKTKLGRNVLIENAFYGLIYSNEIYEKVELGDVREGYIKSIREDGDIDISLQRLGYGRVISSSQKILELLKANQGELEIGDKSSPEKIASITGMSKKTFKKAIGDLYRKKLVLLEKEKIKLKV